MEKPLASILLHASFARRISRVQLSGGTQKKRQRDGEKTRKEGRETLSESG